jgi:hypothetical protein
MSENLTVIKKRPTTVKLQHLGVLTGMEILLTFRPAGMEGGGGRAPGGVA